MNINQDFLDRMKRLKRQGKLEVLAEILVDPKREDAAIGIRGVDQLFELPRALLFRLQRLIGRDDPKATALHARLLVIQISRTLREAKEELEMAEEKRNLEQEAQAQGK